VLIFVVARTHLARYEELRRHLEGWHGVRVVLDRREGERRAAAHNVFGNGSAASGATPASQCRALFEARLGCCRCRRNRPVKPLNFFAELQEFVHDHHSHGPLTGDATEPHGMATCSGWRAGMA